MIPVRIGISICVPVFLLLAMTASSDAKFLKVRIDLKHPLSPVQIGVGKVTVTPSVIGPPKVTDDGSGGVAKIINKVSPILQKPQDIANTAIAAPVKIVHSIITLPSRTISGVNNYINGVKQKALSFYESVITSLKTNVPYFIAVAMVGLFTLITLAVVFGSLISALIIRVISAKSHARNVSQ